MLFRSQDWKKGVKVHKSEKLDEISADKVSGYVTGAASQLASGEIADNRRKEQNRITGITTGVRKLHPDMYPGDAKVPVNEISDTLVGKVSNARFWQNKPTKPSTQRRIKVAQLRDPEEIKKENEKQKSVRKEETKMDNKEYINEALDCILEDNLTEMKDNLMLALQEKAMEKLEEQIGRAHV